IGCKELVLMEEQDARVPALEPFRVEQVVRTQGAEGEGGTTCNLLCP
ncbi:ALKBH6 isoform 3, partial [Pan troglodytes]